MNSKIDRLNDALAKGKYGWFHCVIWDWLFALLGGMSANVECGVKYFQKKRRDLVKKAQDRGKE